MVDDGTITAIATPRGSGGLSVLRISGPCAVYVADQVFRGRRSIASMKSWTAQYGIIVDPDTGLHVDEVVCLIMREPKSFTGEDTVEFSMHGGVYVTDRVQDIVIRSGARIASPGEFSRRAFVNGRMDLTRAESVAEVIRASTDREAQAAMKKLEGGLQEIILRHRNDLNVMLAGVEAEIDFTDEEDVVFLDRHYALVELSRIEKESTDLIDSFQEGRLLSGGISVGLFGKVNVGKSSLFNALIHSDRAIVTAEPGTTRDTIEAEIQHEGYRLRIIDTAGLREGTNEIEVEGISRSWKTLEEIDLAVLVIDVTEGIGREDCNILERISSGNSQNTRFLICCNKIDLNPDYDISSISKIMGISEYSMCPTSALLSDGIYELKNSITSAVRIQSGSREYDLVVTSKRQKDELTLFRDSIRNLKKSIEKNTEPVYLAQDFRDAIEPLDRIVGNTDMDDVLDVIFHKFCIGK